MICMAKYRAKKMQRGRQRRSPHRPNDDPNVFAGKSYIFFIENLIRVKYINNRFINYLNLSVPHFFFTLLAVEWVGPNSDERNVKVKLDRSRKKIHVEDMRRKPLRMLDLRSVKQKVHYRLSSDGLQNIIAIRVQGEIDLVRKWRTTPPTFNFKLTVESSVNCKLRGFLEFSRN